MPFASFCCYTESGAPGPVAARLGFFRVRVLFLRIAQVYIPTIDFRCSLCEGALGRAINQQNKRKYGEN